MTNLSTNREPLKLTKTQLKAAVDNVDKWLSDVALSYNLVLPPEARTNLTAKQKVMLLRAVIDARFTAGVFS